MPVSNNSYYKPEEALQELQLQENILRSLIDVQTALRILVDMGIVTREEVQKYRNEVTVLNIKLLWMIFRDKREDSRPQRIIHKNICRLFLGQK